MERRRKKLGELEKTMTEGIFSVLVENLISAILHSILILKQSIMAKYDP
jgi:hypothetical protein